MNLPNKLTLLRVILIPFFMFFLLVPMPYGRALAFAVFIVASLTDWMDGYIARKYNLVTKFGQFMDPLADKLLVTAALVVFVEIGKLASWVVVLILAREFIISIFRAVAASEGIVIAASKWGKFKTVSQMIMIVLILLNNYPFSLIHFPADQIFVWISVILTFVSGYDYLNKNRSVLSEGAR